MDDPTISNDNCDNKNNNSNNNKNNNNNNNNLIINNQNVFFNKINNNNVVNSSNLKVSGGSGVGNTITNTASTPLKKELSAASVPFIPGGASSTSTSPPPPPTINASTLTSQYKSSTINNVSNNIMMISTPIISSNSAPFIPQSMQQQQQQQQSSSSSITTPISLSSPISSSSSLLLNNAPLKVGKESIETLFRNRFHPKNNIRETVLSSLQSILIPDTSDSINNTKENIDFFYNIIIDENNYILKQLLLNIINDTKRNLVVYNYNQQHQLQQNNTTTTTNTSTTPIKSSKRSVERGRRIKDKNKDNSTITDRQHQHQLQQLQLQQQLDHEGSSLYLPFSNLLSFIKVDNSGSHNNNNNNSSVETSELIRPTSLPKDDSDSDNLFIRVLEYNLKLLTKIYFKISNYQDSIQSHIFDLYSQISKSITEQERQLLEKKDKSPSIPQPIVSFVIPTVLVSIGDIIKFKYATTNQQLQQQQLQQQSSSNKMEEEEKFINNILINEFKKSDVSIIESNLYLFECILSISVSNEPSSILPIGYILKFNKELFRKLIALVYSTIVQHQISLSTVFTTLVLKGYLNEDQIQKLLNVTLFKLSDPNEQVKLSYLTLLSKMVSYFDLNHQKNLNHKVNDISLPYKLLIMRSSSQPFFNGQIFKKIFDWILSGTQMKQDEQQQQQSYDSLTKYLIDLFDSFNVVSILFNEQSKLLQQQSHSAQSTTITPPLNLNQINDKKKFETLISKSDELIWFWAVWESSKFCIVNRLKSPYGSAFQTFEIFERALLQLNRDRSDFKKIKILLHFMESLEKFIFSTVNGSVLLPLPNLKEIQFFKHNVRVCEDWFSRIRVNLLKASILSSSTPDIIRHSSLRVQDIRVNRFVADLNTAQFELEFCVLHLANALQQLNETESLQGLSNWSDINLNGNDGNSNSAMVVSGGSSFFNSSVNTKYTLKLPWMKGVILRSKQKFEESIQTLLPIPSTLEPSSISFPFVLEQIIKSYLDISNFTEIEQFLQNYQNQIQQQSNSLIIYKDTFIKTLGSFYRGEMEEAHAFAKRTESQNHILQREQLGLGLLGNQIMTDELLLSIMVNQKELLLSSSSSSSSSSLSPPQQGSSDNCNGSINSMLKLTKNNILKALNYLGLESNVQTFQYLTQLKIMDEIENGVYNSKVVPINNQIGFLERLRRVRGHISNTKQRSDILLSNIPLTEKMIKLARKFENYKFSSKLLDTILESHSQSYYLERCKLKYLSGKQIDATLDLIKYSQRIDEITNSTSTSSSSDQDLSTQKFKVYTEIIKYLNSNPSIINNEQSKSIPSEQLNPEYYFKKATLTKPDNSKLWITYADWILNEKNNSSVNDQQQQTAAVIDEDNVNNVSSDEMLRLKNTNINELKTAVEAYFQFLKYSMLDGNSNGGLNIRATLKILNILVCSGNKLIDTFERCLNELSSTRPFTIIIPQLFARLSHPDSFVQKYVIEILDRIGRDNPNKIIYQTIVGSLNFSGNNNNNNNNQEEINQDLQKQYPNYIQISKIKENLLKHSQLLVSETETFINQLGKVTTLWDDNWQYFLEQAQGWIYSNSKLWNDEYQQLKSTIKNQSILKHTLKKKNQELFLPIYEKLKRLTSQTVLSVCKTPHEKWFIKTHFETINKTIRGIEKQNKPIHPFDALQDLIANFQQNRLNSLSLYAINPSLALFRPTITQMPGTDLNYFSTSIINNNSNNCIINQNQITIQSIQPTIYLLPTKTKPKKMSMVGSDGNLYYYLLKGREDLHLDERIMQLLNIVDQLLMNDKKPTLKLLRTRNYSVIPLSQSSGLIQWVEGAVPLFSIYKNWYKNDQIYKQQQQQQQQQTQQATTTSAGGNNSATNNNNTNNNNNNNSTTTPVKPIVVRPVDIFYSKITPLLEKKGFNFMNPRSEWPKDVLVQVFNELMQETPRWILQRELWFSSSSSSELFLKTQSYSRSLALMSVIGYIIGLGDRHLDNILVDLKTGEIVHIDYNICFEKGAELKIPEKVPFRMTQIFEYALGLTGVQGTFRETSIQIMHLLRKNKDILLNLLETFIYDPLFDWKHSSKSTMTHIDISKDNMNQAAGEHDQDKKQTSYSNVNSTPTKQQSSSSSSSSSKILNSPLSITSSSNTATVSTNNQQDSDSSQSQDEEDNNIDGNGDGDIEELNLVQDSSNGKESFKSIQGLTVVNQVRLKLEGTEKKLSIPDQVDLIIRESMNVENLASTYEGWSPWV